MEKETQGQRQTCHKKATVRNNDFHKQEATRSLWDQDGYHIPKKSRTKGTARNADKMLIQQELEESAEAEELWQEEVAEALYCYHFGPCEKCNERRRTS